MRSRNRTLKILGLAVGVTVALLIIACFVIYRGKKALDATKAQVSELTAEIQANQQTVYVPSKDIVKGEPLTEDVLMTQQIFTGLNGDMYMKAEDIGSMAVVDIKAGQPVMKNMVSLMDITVDERVYEMTVAHLMTTQDNYDTVDIRVMFPNGEDYLILTKKNIMDLRLDSSVFSLYLNEDEILRMSSAIIDAYTTTGAKIYTTRYVEPNVQEEAIPNYPVRPATLDLINSDPNIVERAELTLNLQARMDLDARLQSLSNEQLDAVSGGLNLDDTARTSVIREGSYTVAAPEENTEETGNNDEAEGTDSNENTGNPGTDSLEEEDSADTVPAQPAAPAQAAPGLDEAGDIVVTDQ